MKKILIGLMLSVLFCDAVYSKDKVLNKDSVFQLNSYETKKGSAVTIPAFCGTATVIKVIELPDDLLLNKVYLLTCAHVVNYNELLCDCEFKILNSKYPDPIVAKVIHTDYKYDVAILEAYVPKDVQAVEFADEQYTPKTGEIYRYWGYGITRVLPYDEADWVLQPIRQVEGPVMRISNYLYTYVDAYAVGGDSGSLVFNEEGKVVGMVPAFVIAEIKTAIKDGLPAVILNNKAIFLSLKKLNLCQ